MDKENAIALATVAIAATSAVVFAVKAHNFRKAAEELATKVDAALCATKIPANN